MLNILGIVRGIIAGFNKVMSYLNTRELLDAGEARNQVKTAAKQLELHNVEDEIKSKPVAGKSDILDELQRKR